MIYDITRELFSTEVYPGDPVPRKEFVMSFQKEEPDVCQLTELTLGSHTGTHMDAPRHFFADGKSIAEVDLNKCMGPCKVVAVCMETEKEEAGNGAAGGVVTREALVPLLEDHPTRLLLKGAKAINEEAAKYLVEQEVQCIGVESLSVAPLSAPVKVHRILLGAEIIILEGLDLQAVPEGNYDLMALPLKMESLDGSPVRAVLCSKPPF